LSFFSTAIEQIFWTFHDFNPVGFAIFTKQDWCCAAMAFVWPSLPATMLQGWLVQNPLCIPD
jgi:hypothetical protein